MRLVLDKRQPVVQSAHHMTNDTPQSGLRRTAEEHLNDQGTTLEVFILDGLDEPEMTYDKLAEKLAERTKVYVSGRQLRRWHYSIEKAAS